MSTDDLLVDDGTARCWWCGTDSLYQDYHDNEWGFPVDDDRHLFEKLSLEAFQCGLSWITILRRREGFRAAFRNFDIDAVSRFTPKRVERLLTDERIIRHRGKIEATIDNAARTLDVIAEFGTFASYIWTFAPPRDSTEVPMTRADIAATTDASHAMSRDLKRRGFRFVGPTTCYAFMQSMGLVNDHLDGCDVRKRAAVARDRFRTPA